jgi:dTMP kinase
MITTTTSAATPPASSSSTTPNNNHKRRGAFILLEGVDRCGKTTQVGLLVKHLLSLSIATVAYRFPDRTTQGE